jgi:hypothetical protein
MKVCGSTSGATLLSSWKKNLALLGELENNVEKGKSFPT